MISHKSQSWLGSGLPCLLPDLGFPEFESIHLKSFFFKAQLLKSVASTIPPHPQVNLGFAFVDYRVLNCYSIYLSIKFVICQLVTRKNFVITQEGFIVRTKKFPLLGEIKGS